MHIGKVVIHRNGTDCGNNSIESNAVATVLAGDPVRRIRLAVHAAPGVVR